VNLDRPVPVHLQYWTAFADEDDIVHFWDGIYQRDARVPLALDAEPADL